SLLAVHGHVFTSLLPPYSPLFPYTTLFRSLGVDRVGVVHRELGLVLVELVLHLLRHRERPGQRNLGRAGRVLDQKRRVGDLDRRSEEHTSELQSLTNLVCRLLLEKKNESSTSRCSSVRYTYRPCPGKPSPVLAYVFVPGRRLQTSRESAGA